MKKRDIFILCFAITALYHIFSVITNYTSFSLFLRGVLTASSLHPGQIGKWFIVMLPSNLLLLGSIILWLYAGRIADSILNKTQTPENTEQWNLAETLTLAVTITGFFLLFGALRTIPLSSLSALFMENSLSKYNTQYAPAGILELTVCAVKILIGLLFIASPKRFVSMLTNRIHDETILND